MLSCISENNSGSDSPRKIISNITPTGILTMLCCKMYSMFVCV